MAEQLYFKCTFEGCTHRPFSYFTINEHMAYHVKKKYETTEHFNLRCTQCNAFFMGNVHAEDHAKTKKHLVVANALKIFGKSDGTRRWVEMMKKWVRHPSEEEMTYMENQVFGCNPAYDRGRTPANDRGWTPGFERGRTPGMNRGRTPGFERGRTPGMDRGRTPANDRGRTPAFDSGRNPANERRRSPDRGKTPGFDRGRTPGFDRGRTPGFDRGRTPGFDRGRTPGFDRGRTPGFDRGRTPGFDRGRNPVDRGRTPGNDRGRSPDRGRTPGFDRGRTPGFDRGRSHGRTPVIRRPLSPPNVERVYRPSSPEILLSDDGGYSPGTVRSFASSRSATPRSTRVSPCRNINYEYGSFNAFRPHPKSGYNREYDQEKHRPERRMRSELDLHNDRHSFNRTDAGRQMLQGSYSTGELGPRDNGDDVRDSTSTSNLGGRLHQEQSTQQTTSDGHRVEENGGNSRENNENVPSDRRAIRSGAPPGFSPQKKFVSADPHPYATPRLLPNQESVKTKDNTVSSTIPTILINQDDSPEVQQSPEVIILENDATTTKKSQKKSTKGGKSKSKKGRIDEYGPAPPPEDDGELSPLVITPNFKASQSEEKTKKDKMKKSLRKRHLVSDSEEDDGKKKKKKKKRDRSRRRRRSSSGSSSHDSRSPSRHSKRSRTRSRRRSRDSSTDSRSRRGRHSSKHEKRRSHSKDLSFSRSPRSK